jgi:hypothetical protein
MEVCPLDQNILQSVLSLGMSDYEDAVQISSAMTLNLDAIVTRNLKDYAGATVPVYAPADFLKFLASNP